MGFTVTRPNGVSDAEFPDYARVVRQTGVDLGRLPRVLDPKMGRRWLYYPETKEKAQALAQDLKERTPLDSWEIVEVNEPASEGPLGPIVIQMVRQADGLYFALHTLSRAMLKTAFPKKTGIQTSAFIDENKWYDFQRTHGGLEDLVQGLLPSLTGLDIAEIESLGYIIRDADSGKTWVSIAPEITHV